MYFVTVLEAMKSKCWQGRFLLRTGRENLLHAFLLSSGDLLEVFGIPFLVKHHSNVHLYLHMVLL